MVCRACDYTDNGYCTCQCHDRKKGKNGQEKEEAASKNNEGRSKSVGAEGVTDKPQA